MRLSTIFAGAVITCTAAFGLAVPAFASTIDPTPTTTQTITPTPTVTPSPTWSPKGGNQGGNNWNKGGDNGNCHQNDGRDNNWNSNNRNDWNRNCDQHGSDCSTVRTLLPWQCNDNCNFLTGWDQTPRWFSATCDHNGDHGRHHHNRCFPQLVVFNFPHGSSILAETQGPSLSVNEVASYQGQVYTIVWVHHTGFFGHDLFMVDNSNGHLVTNHGPSIWHGEAHVLNCSCNRA